MFYQKKAIPLLVLKLPDGTYRVRDLYHKEETLTAEEFARYVEVKQRADSPQISAAKESLELAISMIQNNSIDEGLEILQLIQL